MYRLAAGVSTSEVHQRAPSNSSKYFWLPLLEIVTKTFTVTCPKNLLKMWWEILYGFYWKFNNISSGERLWKSVKIRWSLRCELVQCLRKNCTPCIPTCLMLCFFCIFTYLRWWRDSVVDVFHVTHYGVPFIGYIATTTSLTPLQHCIGCACQNVWISRWPSWHIACCMVSLHHIWAS